jgi:peroxiredoxin-like protein
MNTEHIYNIDTHWLHDRKGVVSSPEIPVSISVATPPDFPKGIAGLWSPEHLFVASVSSCYMATFLAIADNLKLNFSNFTCPAQSKVDKIEGKFHVTEITLKPTVTIPSPEGETMVQSILEKSEKNCIISLSIKSNIRIEAEIRTVTSSATPTISPVNAVEDFDVIS